MEETTSPPPLKLRPAGKVALFPKAVSTQVYTPKSSDLLLREAHMSARPTVLTGLGIIGFFALSILLWAVYVPLRADIHLAGEIVYKTKRQTVQHLEGGIVKEILVQDGDLVQAGQPLIKLESNQVRPLVDMLDQQSIADAAYLARVEAESKDLSGIHFPSSIAAHAKDPAVARVIQSEQRLFTARLAAYQNQVQLLRAQMAQIAEGTRGTQQRLATKRQELALLREQLEANQSLQKQGYVTNTVVQEAQRALAAQTGEYDMLAASIAADKQRRIELEQRVLALKAERIQAAVNEIKQCSLRRIDDQEKARPLRDTLQRQIIRAPIAGKVVGLKVTTVGGVILPRETLLEIAPTGEKLLLEAKIRLEDISEVKIGQQADVMISGLHLLARPDVKARLKYISDDRISVPGQQPYYAAQLEFDEKSLKTLGEIALKPGMTAQVNIATRPHTPFSDMVDSIQEHFRKTQDTR